MRISKDEMDIRTEIPAGPSSHNASMEEAHVFTIDVAQDARQRGRYRWSVSENMKVRDTSFYSFTTRREAQADADKFVETLKAIWQPL
jgi:hypothetical protein